MDKDIISIVKNMDKKLELLMNEVSFIKKEVAKINSSNGNVENNLKEVVNETKNLIEFRNEVISKIDKINDDLYTVEVITAHNYSDIMKLTHKNIK
ncbi:Hypothetical protein CM240_3293 [Clostridium bornimense]|uniref:Plasmid-related protein n=1 Tax=Clostridium bornimense TaxID=1216932 RepID=W6SKK3_9CLOT|nr:hypothetical protein [Clostridium bornimense]CDM70410.1 Hypothetical protein CM240_3293 [Clostridium bornimense]